MSLEFTIELIGSPKGVAASIAARDWTPALRVGERDGMLQAAGVHDALTDDAAWAATAWDMDVAKLAGLDDLLRTSYQYSAAGIRVGANWAGQEVESIEAVTLDALLDLIEHSRLGTSTSYLIEKKS